MAREHVILVEMSVRHENSKDYQFILINFQSSTKIRLSLNMLEAKTSGK